MTDLKQQYENAKEKVLNDKSICQDNRTWIKKVLEFQETKGKRKNGIPKLDNACYKTLLSYINRLRNTNLFFNNKPLKNITKADIQRVYDELEDGIITNKQGKPFKDKQSYYNKIFKSQPFRIIGKEKIAKDIIIYNTKIEKEVNFISDYRENLKKIVNQAIRQEHKGFIQLCGDFGENMGSILQLEARDFTRKVNKDTGEVEYLLNFRKEILKRSRTPRSEINVFSETVEILDELLKDKKPNDKLFNFGPRQAEQIFSRAVKLAGVKLQNGKTPTLKDLRSSIMCYLLNESWTCDEIKSRLGHKPSSNVLDCYVTYLACDKLKVNSHKRVYQGNVKELKEQIEQQTSTIKLQATRLEQLQDRTEQLEKALNHFMDTTPPIQVYPVLQTYHEKEQNLTQKIIKKLEN